MKTLSLKIIMILIVLLNYFNNTLNAQVKIGDNPAAINSSSMLELESTDKGILIPRLTEGQRSNISNPTKGLLVYQSNQTEGFYYYDGIQWRIMFSDTSNTYTEVRNLYILAKGTHSNKTTTVHFDFVIGEQFGIEDELYFDVSDFANYAGGDLTINFGFIPMGNETNKNVRWNIEYKVTKPNTVVSGSTGTIDSGDIPLSATQYTEQIVELTIPAAELVGFEDVHFKIKRANINSGSHPNHHPAIIHTNVEFNAYR